MTLEMGRVSRALCVAVLVAVGAFAQAAQPQKAMSRPPFAWPDAGKFSGVESPIAREQVDEFLTAVCSELWGFRAEARQFMFVQLAPGRATLIATLLGDRPIFDGVAVDWDGSLTVVRVFTAAPPYDLEKRVVDVDGDGLAEIVSQQLALGYEGAATKPVVWSQIFKARADYTLEDVSARNRAYYEKVIIPELEDFDGRLAGRYEGVDLVSAKAQVQFVRDKYRRMLNGEREAGLRNALAWSQSAQRELQRLAIRALQDIGTKEAREEIVRLSEGSDGVVASAAKLALYVMDAAKP